MLVVTRKVDEVIQIGPDIRVMVVHIGTNKVRLGIEAPPNVPVHRLEVAQEIEREAMNLRLQTGNSVTIGNAEMVERDAKELTEPFVIVPVDEFGGAMYRGVEADTDPDGE